MKQVIPYLIIAFLIFCLFWKGCDPVVLPIPTEDLSQLRKIEAQIEQGKAEVLILHDTVVKVRNRYIAAKTLTVTITDTTARKVVGEVISACDSLDASNKRLTVAQDTLISQLVTVNSKWHNVHARDSMAIDSMAHSNKKWWNGFKWGFGSGVLLGGAAVQSF